MNNGEKEVTLVFISDRMVECIKGMGRRRKENIIYFNFSFIPLNVINLFCAFALSSGFPVNLMW